MNEKRFEWCADGIDMWDNQKEERIYSIDFEEAFNELAEENEQLKQRIKELEQEIEKLDTFKKILDYAEKESNRVDWQSYCEKEFEGL